MSHLFYYGKKIYIPKPLEAWVKLLKLHDISFVYVLESRDHLVTVRILFLLLTVNI